MFVFILKDIQAVKFSASETNNSYRTGEDAEVHIGVPDVKWECIAFIKDEQKIWARGVFFTARPDLSNLITDEDFIPVSNSAMNSIQKGTLGQINGKSLEDGDITFDLSLYRIVNALPTTDIKDNKIYLVANKNGQGQNVFDEYIFNSQDNAWELLGQYKQEIDLSPYIKLSDADKRYVKVSTNNNASMSTDKNGALSNFSDNGQAYLAVRPRGEKFLDQTYPYAGASFGVKDDGTAAFSHKTYTTYNKTTGAYSGARNTAVLQFACNTGLRYAKNSGTANDVTNDMYRYVGVIDSPDEFQRVYSAKQVDDLLREYHDKIDKLTNAIIALGGTVD